jgi:predicted nicotinamide N-methyase
VKPFHAANAARNGVELETLVCAWEAPEPLVERGPWDLVLAADVLYERRNVDQLVALLPHLVTGGEILIADPGRPHVQPFLDEAAERWEITAREKPQSPAARLAIYALRRRG